MTTIADETTTRRPARRIARRTLAAIAVANLLLINFLYALSLPGSDPLVDIGRFCAVNATCVLALQLVLVARIPWLDHRIGTDRLTSWHRVSGMTLVTLLVTHGVFITLGYAHVSGKPLLTEVLEMETTVDGVLFGTLAVVLLVLVAFVSARFARRRLPYQVWHVIHLGTYAAVVLGFLHASLLGTTFARSAATGIYLDILWFGSLAALLTGRLLLPMARNLRHRLRVVDVRFESPDVVSVLMTGRDLRRLRARAGQFFLWRFAAPGLRWQAHPYSLSAAPHGNELRITVKAVGESSARLRALRPGTRVYFEGPYGAFTGLNRLKDAALLIAGGVGVTPIRALLEELRGHAVVLYRARSTADAVLIQELDALAKRRGAVLYLLTGPSAAPTPRGPVLGPANIAALVPDVRSRDVFVCGPGRMTATVLRTMDALGVPAEQVHSERFGFAT
ncbi:ferric reductase-like transmembrane domain-containing protein [Amycolatopsis sp. GM8]|uniref:ferredoxin reductase family protein n=1 Tax=Amycolatopsis sp. GM8 TaxID=2896530 RepID=UPI001F41D463|nr:ferric reductase-like transmembrane domain-containing protein [Amycolatopsis sp. GM8]